MEVCDDVAGGVGEDVDVVSEGSEDDVGLVEEDSGSVLGVAVGVLFEVGLEVVFGVVLGLEVEVEVLLVEGRGVAVLDGSIVVKTLPAGILITCKGSLQSHPLNP